MSESRDATEALGSASERTHDHHWCGFRHWPRSEAEWERWWSGGGEWGGWWRTDRLDAAGWAAVLFWAALVVIAENSSVRDQFDWWAPWGVFWFGFGAITLLEAMFRIAVPRYRWKWAWKAFWGLGFLTLGLAQLAGAIWLALPLIAGAVLILMGAAVRR